MVSQVVAGDGVEHAAAEEGGADQQVDDVKHWIAPNSPAAGLKRPFAELSLLRCSDEISMSAYRLHAGSTAVAYKFHINARAWLERQHCVHADGERVVVLLGVERMIVRVGVIPAD